MFRDGKLPGDKYHLNVILGSGGLGDHICSLVAMDYICRKAPWIIPHLWVPDYLLDLSKNLLAAHKSLIIKNYSDAKRKYNKNFMGVTTEWKTSHTAMRTHPVDYAFHMIVDSHVENEEKNYLKVQPIDISEFNLPKKYVVVPVGSTSEVKEMPVKTTNDISAYCIAMGYTPVFVGSEKNPTGGGDHGSKISNVDYSLGINLVNKTNLLQMASIITSAKCIVGLDGGLMHLAGTTDIPIICGYTFASPKHLMPIRNNELGWNVYPIEQPESLGCRYCQTNMIWTAEIGHDFRDCYYKDFLCVKNMTFDRFQPVLEKILTNPS